MQLSEMCAQIAPWFDTTPQGLRVRQQELYKVPKLRAAGMTGRKGLTKEALVATIPTTALLVLTAMLGHNKDKIAPAVTRMWGARCTTPGAHPLNGCETFGAALIALLERKQLRARLDTIDIMIKYEVASLWWRDYPEPSRFHPHNRKEWEHLQRNARMDDNPVRINRVPAATLDKVAALIERDMTKPATM